MHYYPPGLSSAFGHGESWSLVGSSIAAEDGCLAPGDTFTLRSKRDGSYLSDSPITLVANAGYGIYDDGETLEYNDIGLVTDDQQFDRASLTWSNLYLSDSPITLMPNAEYSIYDDGETLEYNDVWLFADDQQFDSDSLTWSTAPSNEGFVTVETVENSSSWHLRLATDVENSDCITSGAKIYLRNGPVGEDAMHYHPPGLSSAFGHSESWNLVGSSIAAEDGCLAPGDTFTLRSNRDGSSLSYTPITLVANAGYGIYDDGETLEYNDVAEDRHPELRERQPRLDHWPHRVVAADPDGDRQWLHQGDRLADDRPPGLLRPLDP